MKEQAFEGRILLLLSPCLSPLRNRGNCWDCLSLKTWALRSYETSVAVYLTPQPNSLKELNLQQHYCENLTSNSYKFIIVDCRSISLFMTHFSSCIWLRRWYFFSNTQIRKSNSTCDTNGDSAYSAPRPISADLQENRVNPAYNGTARNQIFSAADTFFSLQVLEFKLRS